jgi:hypothetical protein
VKAFLNPYNRQAAYIYSLAQYMFHARCLALRVNEFQIAAQTDWSAVTPLHEDPGAT